MEKKFPKRLKIYWMDLSVVNTLLWVGGRLVLTEDIVMQSSFWRDIRFAARVLGEGSAGQWKIISDYVWADGSNGKNQLFAGKRMFAKNRKCGNPNTKNRSMSAR